MIEQLNQFQMIDQLNQFQMIDHHYHPDQQMHGHSAVSSQSDTGVRTHDLFDLQANDLEQLNQFQMIDQVCVFGCKRWTLARCHHCQKS